MIYTIDDKIIANVAKRGRGAVLFPNEFSSIGNAKAVAKALERLVNDRTLIRLARGIYYYPKVDKELGLGVLYPSYEDIAQRIAQREKTKIAPSGAYAMNMLGLTTQVPMNIVFLTDGNARKIKLQNGHAIVFKHAVPKNFAFQNKTIQLITTALKAIGKNNVTNEHVSILKKVLANIPKEKAIRDYKLIPVWIQTLMDKMYA